METRAAIESRASVREFKRHHPVTRELLEALVDAGRRAPSARAMEPWEFVVITQTETLQTLGDCMPNGRFVLAAAACIVVLCKDSMYYLEDGCAATENILLAAVDAGLGACWIAGDKKDYAPSVLKRIGAPSSMKLISLIALGWPKAQTIQHKQRSLQDVLHWEKF